MTAQDSSSDQDSLFETAAPAECELALSEQARIEAQGRRFDAVADDCKIAWRSWGSGPAVVLLHGGSGGWNHWIRNVLELADAGFTVLAPDMPGYGDSGHAPQPHGAATLARVLSRSLRAAAERPAALLEPDAPVAIVGFSFGGVVATQLARLEAGRARQLVLVGAMGLGVTRERATRMRAWKGVTDPAEFIKIQRHNLGALMLHNDAAIDALALGLHMRNTHQTRFVSKWISRSDEALALLPQLDASLHGIWGVHDITASEGVGQRERLLRAVSPGCGFDVIADAGHWVQYEQAPAFNKTLIAALQAAL